MTAARIIMARIIFADGLSLANCERIEASIPAASVGGVIAALLSRCAIRRFPQFGQ